MLDHRNQLMLINYKVDLYSWLSGYSSKREAIKRRFKENIIEHFLFKN